MNRTDRLVSLVMFLQGRRVVCAEELAGHFEVSVRTIYRDVSALCEAGVPVVGEAGVGYSLVKGYHLPPVAFTTDEVLALFVGGEMVRQFADDSLRPPIAQALLKLRAVLPRDRQDDVDRLAAGMAIGGPCQRRTPDQRWLLPIQQALVSRRVLRLSYQARAATSPGDRDVEALGVMLFGGTWYLAAWCRTRAALRHFRLDRIVALEMRGERFAPRAEFTLTEHLAQMETREPKIQVRLRVRAEVVDRLRRDVFSGCEVVTQADAPWVDVQLTTHALEPMAGWLLSFGDTVKIVSPEALQREVWNQIETLTAHHGKNGGDGEATDRGLSGVADIKGEVVHSGQAQPLFK